MVHNRATTPARDEWRNGALHSLQYIPSVIVPNLLHTAAVCGPAIARGNPWPLERSRNTALGSIIPILHRGDHLKSLAWSRKESCKLGRSSLVHPTIIPDGSVRRLVHISRPVVPQQSATRQGLRTPVIIKETDSYWVLYKPKGWSCDVPSVSDDSATTSTSTSSYSRSLPDFVRSTDTRNDIPILDSTKHNFGAVLFVEAEWAGFTIIAKTEEAHALFTTQFESGAIESRFEACVIGPPIEHDVLYGKTRLGGLKLQLFILSSRQLSCRRQEENCNVPPLSVASETSHTTRKIVVSQVVLCARYPPILINDVLNENGYELFHPSEMQQPLVSRVDWNEQPSCFGSFLSFEDINVNPSSSIKPRLIFEAKSMPLSKGVEANTMPHTDSQKYANDISFWNVVPSCLTTLQFIRTMFAGAAATCIIGTLNPFTSITIRMSHLPTSIHTVAEQILKNPALPEFVDFFCKGLTAGTILRAIAKYYRDIAVQQTNNHSFRSSDYRRRSTEEYWY